MGRLDSLPQLRIARPCPARWEDMAGDETVRFCDLCQKNVYNLSAMSREAATKLIAEREGNLCARFYRRSDGTVLTSDCPVGLRAFALRITRRVAAAMASLLLIAGGRYLTPEDREPPAGDPHNPQASSFSTKSYRQLSPAEKKLLEELVGSLGYVDTADPRD